VRKELFVKNRKDFCEHMEDLSFAVFFSGEAPHKSTDQYYPYVANRNFYYLTGLPRPNYILVLGKNGTSTFEYLFIEEATDFSEKWLGHRLSKEEAANISGFDIKTIFFLDHFEFFIGNGILSDSRKNMTKVPHNLYLDLYRTQVRVKPVSLLKMDFILANYPEINVQNANPILDLQRMIKAVDEISEIDNAIKYTQAGLEAVWKQAHAGMNERELDALYEYASKAAGSNGVSFNTIAASGANATTLHYEENNCIINDGDLVLMDLGCLSGPYASDITRTFPISGQFSDRQKALYSLVLEVNKQCIAFVKPNIMMADLNAYARKLLAEGAKKLGVIENENDIDSVYYHSVSHYLGLDVHDVGTYQLPLKPGIVLTIEPGIYVAKERIGIRIEDNVLVTETGSRNLSQNIIKEVADIEKIMSH